MRTSNMPPMSVTLDVSKLNGWLNADADCRVRKELGHTEAGGMRARRQEGVAADSTRSVQARAWIG